MMTISEDVISELREIEALSNKLRVALERLNKRLETSEHQAAGERRRWRDRDDEDDARETERDDPQFYQRIIDNDEVPF